jgi:type II secretory pathway component PulF
MPAFTYIAIDREGRRVSGTLPADSRAAAMDAVMRQGLSPVQFNEVNGATNGSASHNGATHAGSPSAEIVDLESKRVPGKSLESFTRELANLLAAGLSLSRALALLKREASNPIAKATWTRVHDDVVGGESLADALGKFPRTFSSVYVAMVRAGQQGGFLPVVLQQIADFRQRDADLRGRVQTALIYPVILSIVATGVLTFLLTFFIPRFSVIFAQFGSKLPYLTQVVVGISSWLVRYGPFLLIAIAVGGFLLNRWRQTPAGRRAIEGAALKTPALGLVISRFALVRFCRMLGTLVGAGVPLVSSLRTAKEAIGNQLLADAVGGAIEQVQRGTPLSQALATNRTLFPASVIEMISVAEETGRLDQELVRLATSYESDLDRQLKTLVAIVEPLLLVIMAALIGTVVVSMLLPVFTLQDMIN